MGSRRHFTDKYQSGLGPSYQYKPHMHIVGPTDHTNDKPHVGMKKIVENYVIVKPKVERIGGHDDFQQLVNGKPIMQKYNGVKQIAAKEKVAEQRAQERLKRTFTDVGITVMTVQGERSFTQNTAQDLKRIMNEEKA